MSDTEFANFMSRQRPVATQEQTVIDWEAQKNEWLTYIDNLYKSVDSFLKEYIESGQVVVSYSDRELTEDDIGRYQVRVMHLTIGSNLIALIPVGTMLIGTKGRVDMAGPRGTVRLILADKDSEGFKVRIRHANVPKPEEPPPSINWEWKIIVENAPLPRFERLEQDSFLKAIIKISNA
jgi:hypothetical protein